MPINIIVEETEDSRALSDGYDVNQKSIEVEFICWDEGDLDTDPVDVEDAVLAKLNAPPYGDPLYGLRLQTVALRPLTRSIFMATAHYGVKEPFQVDQIRFGFSTAGGSEHITHSLATIASYAATGFTSAPNYRNAINVTRDGIQGTTRGVSQLSFWVTGLFDPAVWDVTQWLNLNDLSYTWNLSAWHGWPAQSVLFEYAEAAEVVIPYVPATDSPRLTPVKFHFKARRSELVNKGAGTGILFTKSPWDHVWDLTARQADSAASAMGNRIQATYREQLYSGSDFTLLGLGS